MKDKKGGDISSKKDMKANSPDVREIKKKIDKKKCV